MQQRIHFVRNVVAVVIVSGIAHNRAEVSGMFSADSEKYAAGIARRREERTS